MLRPWRLKMYIKCIEQIPDKYAQDSELINTYLLHKLPIRMQFYTCKPFTGFHLQMFKCFQLSSSFGGYFDKQTAIFVDYTLTSKLHLFITRHENHCHLITGSNHTVSLKALITRLMTRLQVAISQVLSLIKGLPLCRRDSALGLHPPLQDNFSPVQKTVLCFVEFGIF